MTESTHNEELKDRLYYKIWFEYFMNFDKNTIKMAYQKDKENQSHKVDAQMLREAGYSEEDIQKAILS